MKKTFALLFVAGMMTLAACGGKTEEAATTVDSTAAAAVDSASAVVDSAAAAVDSAASAVVDSLKK